MRALQPNGHGMGRCSVASGTTATTRATPMSHTVTLDPDSLGRDRCPLIGLPSRGSLALATVTGAA